MTGGAGAAYDYAVLQGLVSNTCIGPTDTTWLAGPQLGQDAETLYENMSKTYGGR